MNKDSKTVELQYADDNIVPSVSDTFVIICETFNMKVNVAKSNKHQYENLLKLKIMDNQWDKLQATLT